MKNLGATKQILGIRITRDMKNHVLRLSQEDYIEKVLKRFNMQNVKIVSTSLVGHFKLSMEHSPKSYEEIDYMSKVSYASVVGNLMYTMVSMKPDIAHSVEIVSRFLSKLGKMQWEAVK